MKAWLFFLCLTPLSQPALAGPEASTWSLKYLARASNSLLVASQQALDKQKPICGISDTRISSMSQSLKALVDSKIAGLNQKQKEAVRKQSTQCQSACTCDIFSYYFEQSSDPLDQKALADIRGKASSTTAEARMACAKKFPEFCQSLLLKTISK